MRKTLIALVVVALLVLGTVFVFRSSEKAGKQIVHTRTHKAVVAMGIE